jgi:excisionase family DNA binding protein
MTPSIAIPEGLMSLQDAARLMACSTVTVRRMAKRGDIPATKLPGSRLVRFRRSIIQRVIESGEKHNPAEDENPTKRKAN